MRQAGGLAVLLAAQGRSADDLNSGTMCRLEA
jgi:hypothetical protein